MSVPRRVPMPPIDALSIDGESVYGIRLAVLGVDLRVLTDMARWRRLTEGSFPGEPVYSLFLEADRKELRAVFPRSQWTKVAVLTEPSSWQQLLTGWKVAALANLGNKEMVLALGPVTDRLWDEFSFVVGDRWMI